MREQQFENVYDFFESIKAYNYLILRNYEDYPDIIQSNTHEDIDILCENKKEFIKIIDAKPLFRRNDGVHFYVDIDSQRIPIDIRDVKDGYYCGKWANEMLEHRTKYKGLFYIMESQDYFYSLLYHALIHKKTLSDEYFRRLEHMATKIGIVVDGKESLYKILNGYLKNKEYCVTNSSDVNLIINIDSIDIDLIKINQLWQKKQKAYQMVCKLKRILKKIQNK